MLNGTGETAVLEEHDIVYREAAKPDDPPPPATPAPEPGPWFRALTPDEVLLFRYSALTFNGHRIHYDQPFCVQDEGYGGLIVHGPLLATYLMDLCRRHGVGQLRSFDYRARRPVIVDGRSMSVNGRPDGSGAEVWATDQDGFLATTAEVTFDT